MQGIIAAFANHRIAPNLLMLMMVVSGLLVANRFERRFFPEFTTQTVQVSANWRGASTEDVAESLLTPMENELRNVTDLKNMTSIANEGGGLIYLEFPDHVDLDKAAEDVRRLVDLAAGKLPVESDAPETQALEPLDEIMRLSLAGNHLTELRPLARQMETELLGLGEIQVEISGLPKEIIEIRLNHQRLNELNLLPSQIGRQISAQNVDVSAGNVDSSGANRLLRALSRKKTIADLENLSILDGAGKFVRLRDIAEIRRVAADGEPTIFFNGRPAVQIQINRASGGDSLDGAEKVLGWVEQKRELLPPGITITPHKQEWEIIRSRLDLLIDNGLQGLLLVLLLLFLFLNWRLAIWVALGIPATFMVALCALFLLGGSLDIITMFAFIMTTGIVVDDAIVVGENAAYHLQKGKTPMQAAVDGAKEMFAAVFSSTFTTIASFAPLFIIGGPIGSILFVIPLVVICVLFAALFECFTVLPGHIAGAFRHMRDGAKNSGLRKRMDRAFDAFEEGWFKRVVVLSLRYRGVTIVSAFTMLALAMALSLGGLIKYKFFPDGELNIIVVQATFVSGTPKEVVQDYMETLSASLDEVAEEFPDGDELVQHTSLYMGQAAASDGLTGIDGGGGDETASMVVELLSSGKRQTRLADVVAAWKKRALPAAGLDVLSISQESFGPPGEDLNVRLSGADMDTLKAAASDLQTSLSDINGVSLTQDDLPYGKSQLVFELTSLGRALNLSVNDIATQLRDAFDGFEVQRFYEGVDEVRVRTVLSGKRQLENFASFQVQLPNGELAALADVVRLSSRRGFDTVLRVNAEPVVHVAGKIDFDETDVATVLGQVEVHLMPGIVQQYGVSYSFEGAQADEAETVEDMKTGLIIAFFSIFIILAAVFASWTLPIVIILTAPLGIIGALFGHWLLGYEMSILSMFGIFTLNGIVINDSIVLVRDYLARRREHPDWEDNDLITASVCRRLRAILLTSLTTIGGLTPLMFETSTQAQFLIPMAISICFGLGFATLLILFVMPAYLSIHNSIGRWKNNVFGITPHPTL